MRLRDHAETDLLQETDEERGGHGQTNQEKIQSGGGGAGQESREESGQEDCQESRKKVRQETGEESSPEEKESGGKGKEEVAGVSGLHFFNVTGSTRIISA